MDNLYYAITDSIFTILIIIVKIFFKLIKLTFIIIKKTMSNILSVRHGLSRYQKYVLIIITSISLIYVLYNLIFNSWPYISLILIFNYFIFKSILDVFMDAIHLRVFKRNKFINELFGNKVQIMEAAEEYIILNSFIPIQEIEKQKYKLEHYYNKHIASITNDKSNLRLITIRFKNNTCINLQAKHDLSRYIKQADIKDYELPFMLGINKEGNVIIADLKKTKHILISGEVGSGKSTIENSIIQSLMYFNNNIGFCLVDFKRVGLSIYKNFKNCYFCKEHKSFLELLEKLNFEMDSRYELIEQYELENLTQLNKIKNFQIPFIVMVIDEIADIKLSMEVDNNKIEDLLRRLMNMGRAAGIYTIAATQRPSGVQLSTEIRAALIAKISFAIQEQTTQKMTGVYDTQDLGVGEFKTCNMGFGNQTLKGFYIDRMKSNKTYVDLKEVLGNAVNKQIIEEE